MHRRIYAAIVSLLLVATLPMTVFADHEPPDSTLPQSPDSNSASFWEQEGWTCTKLDIAADTAFVMPDAPDGQVWVLLVVKQGRTNFIYNDPVPGHTYPSTGQNAPGYSHIIVCSAISTTTTQETTSTTEGSTTTTEEVTTTTASSTTSSSEGSTTSSSTMPSTTTTSPTSSSSESVTSSTESSTTDPTLPFTGMDDGLAGAGLALLSSGIFLLALTAIASRRKVDS